MSGRKAGVLLPVSALPEDGFAGARRFVEFLAQAGQRVWQVLPLNPVDRYGSPYNSWSAFAIDERYLAGSAADLARGYAKMRDSNEFLRFKRENAYWLDTYLEFDALRRAYFADEDARLGWYDLRGVRMQPDDGADFRAYFQFAAHEQWAAVRTYANALGIEIMGDMPFYVAENSADTFANERLFMMGEHGAELVGGVPPDYFSEDGQVWNTPVYRLEEMRKDGFLWWQQRVRRLLELYDVLRIDHFRAIEAFYVIPAGEKTARNGKWVLGAGIELIEAINSVVDGDPCERLVAEDLGFITPEVRALLDASGYRGMTVLQFAFDGTAPDPKLYETRRVLYTGTHDNSTLAGWLEDATDKPELLAALHEFCSGEPTCDRLVARTLELEPELCIIPLHDYLGLGNAARINTPGTKTGNWQFRLAHLPDAEQAERMRIMARDANR